MRAVFLYAFDLIELNDDDLRSDPLEGRKATLEGRDWQAGWNSIGSSAIG
jgi:hypothetical protein